jgi:hypothetical protein
VVGVVGVSDAVRRGQDEPEVRPPLLDFVGAAVKRRVDQGGRVDLVGFLSLERHKTLYFDLETALNINGPFGAASPAG